METSPKLARLSRVSYGLFPGKSNSGSRGVETGSFQNLLGNHRSARPQAPPLTDVEQEEGDCARRWQPLSLVEVWWVCFEL